MTEELRTYINMFTQRTSIEDKSYKIILAETLDLNPDIQHNNKIKSLVKVITETHNEIHTNFLLSLILHEAILRQHYITFKEIIKLKSHTFVVNTETFAHYLEKRLINSGSEIKANYAINELVLSNFITQATGEDIKVFLASKVDATLDLNALPKEFTNLLSAPTNRGLSELLCELQYWLYPELNMPLVSVDSEAFQSMNHAQWTNLDEVRTKQSPLHLRNFLELDEPTILMRICGSDDTVSANQNPAALLLAQILLFHGNELITINNKSRPLLTQPQQRACVSALKAFFTLMPKEKFLFCTHNKQNMEISTLKKTNEVLTTDIKALTEHQKKTDEKIARLSALLPDQQQTTPSQNSKFGLF